MTRQCIGVISKHHNGQAAGIGIVWEAFGLAHRKNYGLNRQGDAAFIVRYSSACDDLVAQDKKVARFLVLEGGFLLERIVKNYTKWLFYSHRKIIYGRKYEGSMSDVWCLSVSFFPCRRSIYISRCIHKELQRVYMCWLRHCKNIKTKNRKGGYTKL